MHQHRVFHPDAYLHAALGVAGEEVAGCDIDAGVHPVEEAVDAAVLKVPSHQTADVQVLGLAGHTGAHAADAAHDHVDAHSGTAGFLQLENDVAVADGVVFQDHGSRAAHAGGRDDMVHFFQQHALEPQRGHQHLVACLGQLLHGKVLEHIGGFLADALICRDEGMIGVELAGLLVVVAGADLGDVGVAVLPLFGDEGELGVDLVILKTVDDRAACAFQLLGPVDVVLLVKAGAQLHQGHDFLAVFGRFRQRLHDLGLPRHAVEGHLDGDDVRVVGGLFQHGNEGPDGLVRIAEQHIVLLHLGGKVVVRRGQHGPGRRVEQFRAALGFDAAGELVEKAQVQRAFLLEHPLVGQQQPVAQQPFYLRRGRRRDLQAHSSQFAAALEQLGHDLAVIDVMIHHAFFHVDIRIAGNAEQAFFQNGLLAEDAGCKVQHQFFGKGKQRFAVLFNEVDAFHLAGDGDDAQALPGRVLFLEQHAEVNFLIAQERERVAVVHDLRAEDREQLGLEILLPDMLVLFGQMVKIHLAVAIFGQCFQRFCVIFVAVLLQLGGFGHDGGKLLGGRHVGLVLALFLFALFLLQVRALLQRAHAHHEELVQIGAINGKELDPLGQRHVFILAQRKDPPVEVQPAQLAVDKNGIIAHVHSPFFRSAGKRCRSSAHSCLACPGGHDVFGQARNVCRICHLRERPILLPVCHNGPGTALAHAGQGAQSIHVGGVQVHPGVGRKRLPVRQ